MRSTRIYKWVAFVFIFSITFSACNNDEDIILPQQQATDNGDSTGGTGDNTGNNGDNGNSGNQQGSEGEITLYRVNGDNIEKVRDYKVSGQDLDYQKDVAKHQELWNLVKKVVPSDYRHFMSEFMIYNGDITGSAGYVYQTQNDLSKWQMGIAINYADDKRELTYTVIHEFGHILTLNKTQVNSSITSDACANYFTGEGCSESASYINKLHKGFWADVWGEFQQARDSESAHQDFYEKYKDRFVTNYAATNPGEDIAEVFATFVTMNNKPSGTTKAEQKLLLMYEHDELIKLRDYIRGNVNSRAKNGSPLLLPAPGSWKQANTLGNSKKSHCKLKH